MLSAKIRVNKKNLDPEAAAHLDDRGGVLVLELSREVVREYGDRK